MDGHGGTRVHVMFNALIAAFETLRAKREGNM